MSKYSKGELDILCKDEDFKRKNLSLCLPCWCNQEVEVIVNEKPLNAFGYRAGFLPSIPVFEGYMGFTLLNPRIVGNEIWFDNVGYQTFATLSFNTNIVKVISKASFHGDSTFVAQTRLVSIVTTATNFVSSTFVNCASLTTIDISNCDIDGLGDAGPSFLDDIFTGISGNNITLKIPAYLMTCNGGNPDIDIQTLIVNNTVTIITV